GIGDSGFGIAGVVQLTTNTLFDMATLINGQVKVRVMPEEFGLASVSLGIGYYNLVSAQYLTDIIVEEAFTEEETDIESGLDMLYFFVSASRRVGPVLRLHAGYQHRYFSGNLITRKPIEFEDDGETLGLELEFDQSASHDCMLFGADLDFLDHLKFMLELGYDFSYERARGGAGVRLGIGGSLALQAGIMWPGLELDEDIDIPVLPHFSLFWRF
ncbi:MAG TPA: hypothetical protein VLA34_01295, partial [Candidatus Krumholzibacterium sp.]|nr:hypothetical protein [Candidatus Krumholzibacterium sp.]